jgi:hypothetical protein
MVLGSAMINGMGAGVLFTAEGRFISSCANEDNKGFFFSYYYFIFMASQVFGNLIAALVLGGSSQSTYYIVMAVLAFVATFAFLFLKKPIYN